MDPPLPLEAFDPHRRVDDLLHIGVGVVESAELATLAEALVARIEDLLERDVLAHHGRRHDLRDAIAHREGITQDPRGVLDRLLGLDRAVGHDHRDPILAVLLRDVADHLAAPAFVEVDVEVGHRDPVWVEEPLEDQPVPERVKIGDPQCVGAHGARSRAAAGTDADPVVLGPVDEVSDHQEVAGEAHVDDDGGLEVGLRPDLRRDAQWVAALQPTLHLLDEPAVLVLAGGDRELRHVGAVALGELHIASLRDQERVIAGLLHAVAVLPEFAHLGRGLDVVVVAVELEALGVSHGAAGGDTEQVLVGRRILTPDVV